LIILLPHLLVRSGILMLRLSLYLFLMVRLRFLFPLPMFFNSLLRSNSFPPAFLGLAFIFPMLQLLPGFRTIHLEESRGWYRRGAIRATLILTLEKK
jgi:hypothetical protein